MTSNRPAPISDPDGGVEAVARWLQATYSRWPGGRGAWDELSEKSKRKWRAEADDLLGLLHGKDPDAEHD